MKSTARRTALPKGRGWRIGGTVLGALATVSSSVGAQCPTGKIESPTQSGGDYFGRALAGDDDELVVGSRFSASVFVLDDMGTPIDATDDVWTLQAHLLSQDPAFADGFGASVWLDGDHLVVGAPEAGGIFGGPGAAYIYRRLSNGRDRGPSDDSWTEQVKLNLLSGGPTVFFGQAVCLAGDRAVVGAPGEQLASQQSSSGVVHVYRRDDNGTPLNGEDDSWSEEAVLVSADSSYYSSFGAAVRLVGKHLLVGAPGLAWPPAMPVVYHFRLDDAGTPGDPADDMWIEHAKITPPAAPTLKLFGTALDLDGDLAIVGALGTAYLFKLNDGGTPLDLADDFWTDVAALTGSDAQPFDGFGLAVAVEGGKALVGASAKDEGDKYGAVYLFHDAGAQLGIQQDDWYEVVKLVPPEKYATNFGAAVRLNGSHAFVGERGYFPFLTADAADSDTGSVTAYAMAVAPWSFLDAALAGTDAIPCLLGSGSLAADTITVVSLDQALANAPTALFVGLSALDVPFKGGVLVPMPDYVLVLTTGAAGEVTLSERWPAGVAPGTEFHVQAWTIDPQGPAGLSATNAIRGVTP